MDLKTFRGRSMAETLARVKRHFGRDAVILSTRTVSKGRWLGLAGQPYVEITAAKDLSSLPPSLRRRAITVPANRPPRRAEIPPTVSTAVASLPAHAETRALTSELQAIKEMVGKLVQERTGPAERFVPVELLEYRRRLLERSVAEELADEMITEVGRRLGPAGLKNGVAVRAELARAVGAMVPTSGRIRFPSGKTPHVVALIGPTGVGKTTTIAKLAANACLRENRRVGLITLDTYRIAAVEQLRTYAEIINVPLAVATTPAELSDAAAAMDDRELILIDTAGRSQRDAARIEDLMRFFSVVIPNERHLVLSAAADARVLDDAIRRFEPLGFDRVIFTKMDEAVGFGVVLNCLRRIDAKLSYITTGQDVPDDIAVGDPGRLAELVIEGWSEPQSSPRSDRLAVMA